VEGVNLTDENWLLEMRIRVPVDAETVDKRKTELEECLQDCAADMYGRPRFFTVDESWLERAEQPVAPFTERYQQGDLPQGRVKRGRGHGPQR
jgi:hypothetical protein